MKENKILKWALILSIVIVANLFFNYSLSLVLNSPDHETFCPFEKTSAVIQDEKSCTEQEGIWQPAPKPSTTAFQNEPGYCDLYSKCNNRFEESNKIYEQKVFIALVVIGVLVLIASFFMQSNTVLASAFALTAVLDLVVASMRYWRYSDELLKVGILFIALVALIYLAIKKFKESM
jgi:hypothetical protein